MKRAIVLFAMSVTVFGARVAAQTSVADGVIALANGDYQRAVEILRPVTEGSEPPDRLAAFFMGMLYESGRGVPQDLVRACAHYLRAGEPNDGSPFWQPAMFLLGPFTLTPDNRDAMEECQSMATDGFDAVFEPQSFQLAAGHVVEWTRKGATVWYQGTSKFFPFEFHPFWGGRFLPLRYTELETGRSRMERRDFIELAYWDHKAPAGWGLAWQLFEVVRGELAQVGNDSPASVDFVARPDATSDELRKYVRLDVNDDGDVIWSRRQGPDLSAHVIDTQPDREFDAAEQARIKARETAQAAAAKRGAAVGVRDAARAPSLAYVAADVKGCGMLQVAGWSDDHLEAIVVRTLSNAPASGTFDLTGATAPVHVDVHVYNRPSGTQFCSDYGSFVEGLEERVWQARSGFVTIELASQSAPHRQQRMARVTIRDAVFVSPSGQAVRLSQPVVLTAMVGAFGG